MTGAIWKLSALATVVGMGLLGVVYQQNGFGKGAAQGAPQTAGVPAAPQPNVPGKPAATAQQTPPAVAAAPASADPFEGAAGAPSDAGNEPPAQLNNEPNLPNEASAETQDTQAAAAPTAARTRARGLNFSEQVATEEAPPPQVPVAGTRPRGRRGRQSAEPAVAAFESVSQSDPASLEGTAPAEQEAGGFAAEEDPFAKHKKSLAQRKKGAGVQDSMIAAQEQQPAMIESGASNPFDGGSNGGPASVPVVATAPRNGNPARARFVDDGESTAQAGEPGGNQPTGDVQTVGQEAPSAPQGGYRPQIPGAGQTKAANVTSQAPSQIGDDQGFGGAGQRAVQAPLPNTPGKSATGGRPQLTDDEEGNFPGRPRPNVPGAGSGAQPIPKLGSGTQPGTDQTMPPPVSGTTRPRPNPFGEGDDGPGAASGPAPNIPGGAGVPSSGGITPRVLDNPGTMPGQRRPSPGVLEIDPDQQTPADAGIPEAAASKSMSTQVLPVPQRNVATSDFGTPPAPVNRGQGQVSIEKIAPQTAYLGQPLIYHIVIRNTGSGPTQQVIVEDMVPNGVTMQGSIPQAEMTGNKLTWRIGGLAQGEERKISVKVIPNSVGTVGSSAKVRFSSDQRYASAVAPAPITPIPLNAAMADAGQPNAGGPIQGNSSNSSGVSLEFQAPPGVNAGNNFDVKFRVTNRTGQPMNNLRVRGILPDSLRHETGVQDLEYPAFNLAPGESRVVPLTLTATQTGRATSRVYVMDANTRVLLQSDYSLDVNGGNPITSPANSFGPAQR